MTTLCATFCNLTRMLLHSETSSTTSPNILRPMVSAEGSLGKEQDPLRTCPVLYSSSRRLYRSEQLLCNPFTPFFGWRTFLLAEPEPCTVLVTTSMRAPKLIKNGCKNRSKIGSQSETPFVSIKLVRTVPTDGRRGTDAGPTRGRRALDAGTFGSGGPPGEVRRG